MAKDRRIVRKARKGKPIRQVAAVPFRFDGNGDVEVLLITSNTTRRFIVPKGWPLRGKSGKKTAVTEAKEEAGVVGKALKQPLGVYSYWKRLSRRFVNVTVTVYLMPVAEYPPGLEGKRRTQARLALAGGRGDADRRARTREPDQVDGQGRAIRRCREGLAAARPSRMPGDDCAESLAEAPHFVEGVVVHQRRADCAESIERFSRFISRGAYMWPSRMPISRFGHLLDDLLRR